MPQKRYRPEEIIAKPREAEVLLAKVRRTRGRQDVGHDRFRGVRSVGAGGSEVAYCVSECTYCSLLFTSVSYST